MKVIHSVLILLCISCSSGAFGQSELTQAELNQAAGRHYASADFMLNKAYSQLMAALSGERKDRLKQAQQAWITFRDAHAELVSSAYDGGSIQPLVHTQALINLTEQRTAELTRMHLTETKP
ncbi:lysozyme inhibitor LprI family protein [Zobellella maritima]|uniref:lysozyme inhibitor LprI family protein n=1 Tax=Zobellella maritima TaxID=2059725 RepID=UPI001300AD6B|nr:lysozyme inhibitor LprI family protein [Zobellella maritima]